MPATLEIRIVGQDDSAGAFASLSSNLAGINPAAEMATGALRHVGEIAVDALGSAAQAAAGFVTDSVSAAGEFEAGINRFASVAGDALSAAGFSFDDVSAKALQLGAETQFSAAQAEDAMIALAKGGVPVVDIMGEATDATMNLAAAGELELAKAADIVAKQLGVWGETGVQAADVSNLLAQAANASTVDVDELALGLANVGGTAKSAGVDFDELTQTMALIAPGFSSASDAGTSLKTMISRLQPETKPATEAMMALGLYTEETGSAFYDAQGNFIGMAATAQKLHDATAGLSEAQRVQAFNTIFGSDAIRAAAAIANAGGDGFANMGDAMRLAGDAASQAAQRNQGYAFALESLKGSVETVQIVIGSALLPVLTQLITGVLTPGVNTLMAFAQGTAVGADTIKQLQTAVGAISPTLGTLVGSFLQAYNASGSLSTALTTTFPVLNQVGAAFQQAWTAVQPLVNVLQANLQPILIAIAGVLAGAVVAGLAAAVGAFLAVAAPIAGLIALGAALVGAWQSNFAGIQGVVTSVMSAVWSVISAVVGQITTFWQANGSQILAFAQATWGQIQGVIAAALALIQGIVVPILTAIANFIGQHGAQIQQLLGGAWQVISTIISTALSTIQGILTAALQIIQGDWSGAWETIQETCATIVEGIVGVLEGAVDMLGAAAQMGIDALVGAWQSFTGWTGIGGGIVDGIISGLGSAVGKLAAKAAEIARSALSAAKSALGIASPSQAAFDEVGVPLVDGIVGGIMAASPKAVTAMLDLGSKLIDVVSKGVDAFGKLRDLGTIPESAIRQFADSLQIALSTFANLAATWDKAAISWASQFQAKAGQVIDMLAKAVTFFTGLADVAPIAPSAIQTFVAAIDTAMRAIVDVSNRQTLIGLAGAQVFAKAAGDILKVIGDGVDAMTALQDLVDPPAGSIAKLAQFVGWAVLRFAQAAEALSGPAEAAAASFADHASGVLDLIGSGVEALAALGELTTPPAGSIALFTQLVQWAVLRFAQAASQIAGPARDAASDFADSAGAVLDQIGGGVESLNKLASLAELPAGSIARFTLLTGQIVAGLAAAADDVGSAGAEAAASFAGGAGTALAILGSGVDNLNKVGDLGDVPLARLEYFSLQVDLVVSLLALAADDVGKDAIAAAAAFADGAGRALAILGSGVDNLNKVGDLGDVPLARLEYFSLQVDLVVSLLALAADDVGKDAIAAAAAFADGAGRALGLIGGGVDSLNKLADLKAPTADQIARFTAAVHAVIRALIVVAQSFAADAVSAAAAFSSDAATVLSMVGGGVDSLTKLLDMKAVPDKTIQALIDSIRRVISALISLAAEFSTEGVAAAASFATAVQSIASSIASAIDSFAKLADLKGLSAGLIDSFQTALRSLLGQFQTIAVPEATNLGVVLMTAMARGIGQGAGAVASALASLSQSLATQAVDSVASAVLAGIGGSAVSGASGGQGGTQTTNHTYYISGYSAGQTSDLTTTIRQTQLLQSAIG